MRKLNARIISERPQMYFEQSMTGRKSNITSSTDVKIERVSARTWPNEKNSIDVIEIRNRSRNDNDVKNVGVLDDFLNANGPLSATIETKFQSPDKTTSEMSCLTSPDLVSLFPDPETCSKNLPPYFSYDPGTNVSRSESKELLWIKIESSNQQNTASFCVPVSLMLERELEMQAAAHANKISKERWASSRIFRMWKSQCASRRRQECRSHKREFNNINYFGECFLRLTPEVSLRNSNSSFSSFRWKPWLTACLRSYYNSGNLRISNECTGDDILLTLDYFGILTASPSDFVFDSSHAFVRIQAWSQYFTHRTDLAESLLGAYDNVEVAESDQDKQRLNCTFKPYLSETHVWVLLKEKESFLQDQYEYDVIERSTSSKSAEYEASMQPSSTTIRGLTIKEDGGLYELFYGQNKKERALHRKFNLDQDCEEGIESNIVLSKEIYSRIRQDFCGYLCKSLPSWSSVRFDVEQVKLTPIFQIIKEQTPKATIEYRPVIRIYRNQHYPDMTFEKEEVDSIFLHRKLAGKIAGGDVIMSRPFSGGQRNPECRSARKVSSFLAPLNHVLSYNGQKRNDLEKTGSWRHIHSLTSRESFNAVDTISKLKSNGIETFNHCQENHKPMTYINMELGDLRSVTSVLSEPIVNDPKCSHKLNSNFSAIKYKSDKKWCQRGHPAMISAQKIVQERRRVNESCVYMGGKSSLVPLPYLKPSEPTRSNRGEVIQTPPDAATNILPIRSPDLDRLSPRAESNKDFRNKMKKVEPIVGKYNRKTTTEVRMSETKVTVESNVSKGHDENSETECRNGPTDSNISWGRLLASVCEVIIPAPSSNISSSSPIRKFRISSNKSTPAVDVPFNDENQTCRNDDRNTIVPKQNGFVDQAKRIGLTKKGIESNPSKGPLEIIPGLSSIDNDKDHTFTSRLTSSVV